jgi:hypothetical protein
MYKDAIELFLKKIEEKSSWGKNELKDLIFKCVLESSK